MKTRRKEREMLEEGLRYRFIESSTSQQASVNFSDDG